MLMFDALVCECRAYSESVTLQRYVFFKISTSETTKTCVFIKETFRLSGYSGGCKSRFLILARSCAHFLTASIVPTKFVLKLFAA